MDEFKRSVAELKEIEASEASKASEAEEPEAVAAPRPGDEHAYEDTWYQVLRQRGSSDEE